MKAYQGHKNRNAWNVALWINGEEWLYRLACEILNQTKTKNEAAEVMVSTLNNVYGVFETPDGAPYNKTNVRLAFRYM